MSLMVGDIIRRGAGFPDLVVITLSEYKTLKAHYDSAVNVLSDESLVAEEVPLATSPCVADHASSAPPL